MKIIMLPSKQVTLFLTVLLALSTLFLPLTTLRAATLTNGMNASWVLGAANFTTQTASSGQSGYNAEEPWMTYDDVNDRLFVSDDEGDRILVFDLSGGITNGMNASYVLGQPDFLSAGETSSMSGLQSPTGVEYDSNSEFLYVSDNKNNRILVFDLSGGITNGMDASYVLGQEGFGLDIETTTIDGLAGPDGLAVSGNFLFVVDRSNARVVVYDIETIVNGEDAVYVLGQTDFTSNSGTTSQTNFRDPKDVVVYGDNLFVADKDGNRVMVFDISTIINGEAAIRVLGQDDFDSSATTVDQGSTIQPVGLSIDSSAGLLFVGSSERGSVSVFDVSGSIINGMNASYILGQPDFETLNASITQSGYGGPSLTFSQDNDWLFSGGEVRILIFDLSTTPTPSPSSSGWNYTHPPLCQATFTPNTITKGEPTTLSWNATWPTERENNYYVKVPGEGLYSENVSSIQLTPNHSTVINMALFNLWGANFCQAEVTVLDENGEELTSNQNSYLTAGVSNSPIVKAIPNFFRSIFAK
jgi:hypothetical protein